MEEECCYNFSITAWPMADFLTSLSLAQENKKQQICPWIRMVHWGQGVKSLLDMRPLLSPAGLVSHSQTMFELIFIFFVFQIAIKVYWSHDNLTGLYVSFYCPWIFKSFLVEYLEQWFAYWVPPLTSDPLTPITSSPTEHCHLKSFCSMSSKHPVLGRSLVV